MADLEETVVRFVEDVCQAMGMSLTGHLEHSGDGLRVNLDGEGGDVLLRRKGEALDALQHVTNTLFRKQLGSEHHIVIDCMNFRRAKDAELRQMAKFLVEKARETGVQQEIGPLNPYARRIVHLAVAEDPAATSESIGDAFLKTVIISIRKA
ncbi:MAG: hypothetical protein HYX76_14890 [Acidobacteria bacterium]|nr:hypothetical protein [Acidobacteriota bacterium]